MAPLKKMLGKGKKNGLHYNKEALLREYKSTFDMMLWVLIIVVGIIGLYFFVFITYLGDSGHTKYAPFVERYGDEIEIEYDGLKLPVHEPGE